MPIRAIIIAKLPAVIPCGLSGWILVSTGFLIILPAIFNSQLLDIGMSSDFSRVLYASLILFKKSRCSLHCL